jgi:hypothetical protein
VAGVQVVRGAVFCAEGPEPAHGNAASAFALHEASQHFDVDPGVLEDYGALDNSVVSDLPLFVDPFLLFNSDDPTYQGLHDEILRYLLFLRDLAAEGDLDDVLINNLYRFQEVKQNWLGFTLFGNGGAGLGRDFAVALHGALGDIFADFGKEKITRGTHWRSSA